MGWALSIDKDRISDAGIVETKPVPLASGEVRLAVDRFALTANNITYAAFGRAMRYWDFFPGEDDRGRLPVWGFARIAESRCDNLAEGERIYGYFAAASELVVRPDRISDDAFLDAAGHRADLPPAYNRYVRCRAEPPADASDEAARMILEPLFITAFLLDLHLREESAFEAGKIALTSASSKTALALAFLLHAEPMDGVSLEGLTSAGNAGFVADTGFYDRVTTYDAIEEMDRDTRYTLVDFAGDGALNMRLHTRLDDRLAANIRVGGAHWQDSTPVRNLPGPKPAFFFAPDHARDRIRDWGMEAFQQKYAAAWHDFAGRATRLLDFTEDAGADGALAVYAALVAGDVPAREGKIIKA